MTITVANTSNTSTFEYWLNRTNELADAMSNYAVTTDSNTAVGNAAITGTFTANSINVNNAILTNTFTVNSSLSIGNSTVNTVINSTSISIGNSAINSSSISLTDYVSVGNSVTNVVINQSNIILANSTSNIQIAIPTSAQVSNGQFYLNANGSWSASGLVFETINTSGPATINVDSFSKTSYGAAEYVIRIKDNNANNYSASKLLLMHDGGNAYITEYAMLLSNSSIGTFSVAIVSSNVYLQFAPTSNSTTISFAKVII